MARSRSKHPVAVLRRATGKTAKQFAAWVGVSESLVKQVEHGSRALTEELAREIARRTHTDHEALLKGVVKTLDGKRYTARAFHEQQLKQTGPQWGSAALLAVIELVLDVVEGASHASQVKSDIAGAVHTVVKKYRLESAINREVQARPQYLDQPVMGIALLQHPELVKYIKDPVLNNFKIEDVNVAEQFTLRIPVDGYLRMWRDQMVDSPPPRSERSFNVIRAKIRQLN